MLRFVDSLSHTLVGQTIGRQLARSGPAIGSNYRASCSARSRAEFIAKLGVVVEEAEESVYWLDLILKAQIVDEGRVQALRQEAAGLLAIFARSIGTARFI